MERPIYWISKWIVDRNWQILKRPGYHVLTGVHANYVRSWFVFPLFECLDGRQCSLEISPHPNENNTSWGWRPMSASVVGPASIERLVRALCPCSQCGWRCHWGTLSWKHQTSLPGSCWYNPGTWLVYWSIQKAWLGTQSGHSESWKPSSICLLL